MNLARRMRSIPPYLFAELDRKRAALRAKGVDVINLGIGDPDLPTPPHIIDALTAAARDPATHVYPPYEGTAEFRRAVAAWYGRRFGVTLDPDREVLTLIGSKEGLAHVPWVFVDPGDPVLVTVTNVSELIMARSRWTLPVIGTASMAVEAAAPVRSDTW